MGDRSTGNGGVRNIRAMFEAKTESTSPPSRGRSPAGSEGVRSSSSRPISKVRASFVAVEKSGQMGPIIGLRKLSDSESSAGVLEPKPNGHTQDSPAKGVSGNTASMGRDANTPLVLSNVEEEEAVTDQLKENQSQKLWDQSETIHTPSRKSVKQNNNTSPPIDDTDIVQSNSTEASGIGDLGTVLKGSPFEPTLDKSGLLPPPKEPVTKASAPKEETPVKKQAEATSKSPAVKAAQTKTNGDIVASNKSGELKTNTSRPVDIPLKNLPMSAKMSPGIESPKSIKSPNKEKGTPPVKAESTRLQAAKVASPRQADGAKDVGRDTAKEGNKGPVKKTSRPSLLASRGAPDAGPKSISSTSTASKRTPTISKSQSTSPATIQMKKSTQPSSSAFHKPPPKSPTRPVRLPGSATAPTASSAAKTDAGQSTKSAPTNGLKHKPSTLKSGLNTSNKGGTASLRVKSSRPSLNQAPDRSSSRTSSRPPDEGFLARMMRPTASSASKMHEKLDAKSPPSKSTLAKPKRKSGTAADRGESHEGEEGHGEGGGEMVSHQVVDSIERDENEMQETEAEHEGAAAAQEVTTTG